METKKPDPDVPVLVGGVGIGRGVVFVAGLAIEYPQTPAQAPNDVTDYDSRGLCIVFIWTIPIDLMLPSPIQPYN